MGYEVKKLEIYSMDDHKSYEIPLPEADKNMFLKFEKVIDDINKFDMSKFNQINLSKCRHCIYEPACDRARVE